MGKGVEMGETKENWPYVIKPLWVHDLLWLWRRKQLYKLYLEQVADHTGREVRVESMRRSCVAWLADHFAPSRSGHTLTQNVWASYSHHYSVQELAPAYLVHFTLVEPLVRRVAAALQFQMQPGSPINRNTLLNSLDAQTISPGALDRLLHTLQQWGLLDSNHRVQAPRVGEHGVADYRANSPLRVAAPIFPLLVWCWWLETRQPQISMVEFAHSPLWTWIEIEDFDAGWNRYAGRMWTIETVAGLPTICLRPTELADFTRALLNLLSTDGRSGRQHPHQAQSDAELHAVE
jgi:hypothetical protein